MGLPRRHRMAVAGRPDGDNARVAPAGHKPPVVGEGDGVDPPDAAAEPAAQRERAGVPKRDGAVAEPRGQDVVIRAESRREHATPRGSHRPVAAVGPPDSCGAVLRGGDDPTVAGAGD